MDDLIKILQKLMSESPKPKGGIADTAEGIEFIGRKLTKDEIGSNAIIGSKLTDASRFKPFSIQNVGIENRYSLLREYGDDLAKKFEETITFIKENPDVRFSQMQKDNILYNLGVYRRVVKEKDKIAKGLTEQGKNVDDIFNNRVDTLPNEMLTTNQVLEKFKKTQKELQKALDDLKGPSKQEISERELRLKRLYDGPGYDRPGSSLYRGYGSFFLPKIHEKGIIKLDDEIYKNLVKGAHHYGGADYFAPDPVRIWRKHFGNEVFEKLDNFNPDNEDIFQWLERNNIQPIQKDGPKNALEYLTPTEITQQLADETSAFGKYKNPASAGDDAQYFYPDNPKQRMERITYHGENIGALEQALQTIDPDSYKEYFRTKPTYDSKVLPFKELNAEGGRVGYRVGGASGREYASNTAASRSVATSPSRNDSGGGDGPKGPPSVINPPPKQEIPVQETTVFKPRNLLEGFTQHNINNQKLKNAVTLGLITNKQYNLLGGYDVNQTMGLDPFLTGATSGLYNIIQSLKGDQPFSEIPGDVKRNVIGSFGLPEELKTKYDNIMAMTEDDFTNRLADLKLGKTTELPDFKLPVGGPVVIDSETENLAKENNGIFENFYKRTATLTDPESGKSIKRLNLETPTGYTDRRITPSGIIENDISQPFGAPQSLSVDPYSQFLKEGGRVGFRDAGYVSAAYGGGSKKSTPSSSSFDRPTMADVSGPSQRPASIGPKPPMQTIDIEDAKIFDIEETGDPSQNPFSQNVEGGIDYTPSFTPPTFFEQVLGTGQKIINNPFVRAGILQFLPPQIQTLGQIFAIANSLKTAKNIYDQSIDESLKTSFIDGLNINEKLLEKEAEGEFGIGIPKPVNTESIVTKKLEGLIPEGTDLRTEAEKEADYFTNLKETYFPNRELFNRFMMMDPDPKVEKDLLNLKNLDVQLTYPDQTVLNEEGFLDKEKLKSTVDEAEIVGTTNVGPFTFSRNIDTEGEGITSGSFNTKYLNIDSPNLEENQYSLTAKAPFENVDLSSTFNVQDGNVTDQRYDLNMDGLEGSYRKGDGFSTRNLELDKNFTVGNFDFGVDGMYSDYNSDDYNRYSSTFTPSVSYSQNIGDGILTSSIAKEIIQGGNVPNLSFAGSYPIMGGELTGSLTNVLSDNMGATVGYDYKMGSPNLNNYLELKARANPFNLRDSALYFGLKKEF